jgi:predicted phage baseplate assembly protein
VSEPIRAFSDDACGCCTGTRAETPVLVANRPGLSALAYRIGTHSRFKRSMLERLSSSALPALQRLNTRSDDDFSIGLLDAWATVADLLTFYQQRIANEAYLRTATERRSVLELARLIGYELRPGVAASASLAFIIEDAPGAPHEATIGVGTRVQSIPGPGEQPQSFETVEAIEARAAWNTFRPQRTRPWVPATADTRIYLEGLATGLKPGDAMLFVGAGRRADSASTDWRFKKVKRATPENAAGYTVVEWEGPLGTLSSPVEVYALRQRVALFGHNAPDPRTLSPEIQDQYANDLPRQMLSEFFVVALAKQTTAQHLVLSALNRQASDLEWDFGNVGDAIYLDAVYPSIRPGSWLTLSSLQASPTLQLHRVDTAEEASPRRFTLTAKCTRLTVSPAVDSTLFTGSRLRGVTVFGQSDPLVPAEVPLTEPIAAGEAAVTLERMVSDLPAGRKLIIAGIDDAAGTPVSEVVELLRAEPAGNLTRLVFTRALLHGYRRDSVTISGNVASATHGESVREVLGSGDAAQSFQRFSLHQSPLTHVPATTPSGAESTLQVWADDVRWHQVPTLHEAGASDRVYVSLLGDDGATTIQFGDGVTGARLPSGQENVTAAYRKGMGLAGLVQADQLSLLMTRILGVKSVRNPDAARGAEDRESLDLARRNAPLAVLTLDRVVSLQDYEDFSRAYAGIAKALATWFWDGERRGVFLTVAGPLGAVVPVGSDAQIDLLDALRRAGDPRVPLRVGSHRPVTFHLSAQVTADPDRRPEQVRSAVETALRAAFGFDAREFARPVALSDVTVVIQGTPGVVAVDLDQLYRGSAAGLQARLDAAGPTVAGGATTGAELLTLDPGPLDLRVSA